MNKMLVVSMIVIYYIYNFPRLVTFRGKCHLYSNTTSPLGFTPKLPRVLLVNTLLEVVWLACTTAGM